MQWLMLLAVALVLKFLGQHLQQTDEVHALAIYSAGILSVIWGFAIAPASAQLTLEALAFGWLQVSSLRS
ncbi:MAG: hypothetical protein F6K19_33720 [Cyanothece sp. SIO1E1]|nr:hypothetical protein [Cyanothece sp. SIO1E1]